MKTILGMPTCTEAVVLDAVMKVISDGVKEVASYSQGEYDAFSVTRDLQSGRSQLLMIYSVDDEKLEQMKNFEIMLFKLLRQPAEGYMGFVIYQLHENSFHVFQAYLKPEYQQLENVRFVHDELEKIAKSLSAPYISLSTRDEMSNLALKMGFAKTYTTYRKKL
jgi:hypothetical protein